MDAAPDPEPLTAGQGAVEAGEADRALSTDGDCTLNPGGPHSRRLVLRAEPQRITADTGARRLTTAQLPAWRRGRQ